MPRRKHPKRIVAKKISPGPAAVAADDLAYFTGVLNRLDALTDRQAHDGVLLVTATEAKSYVGSRAPETACDRRSHESYVRTKTGILREEVE
jgi:hypothetical protein